MQFGALTAPKLAACLLLFNHASGLLFDSTLGDLAIEKLKEPECDRTTVAGDTIDVHYRGTLNDGTKFDSSFDRGTPISFTLGAHQVIEGWDQGLLGMCVGEERVLRIPPELAYGHQAVGKIPADSTLFFFTRLMHINGVDAARPSDEEPPPLEELASASATDTSSDFIQDSSNETTDKLPQQNDQVSQTSKAGADENGECRLLGPFALLVQGGLGLLAIFSLVWKRWREKPRRPLKVWFFDVSKQVFGSALLHVANLLISMLFGGEVGLAAKVQTVGVSSVADDSPYQSNPCSFYLINIAVDTTIGIAILYVILRVLHQAASITPLARPPESIKTGHYGEPPRVTWWLKQSIIYFIALVFMKLCVFFIFELVPWIAQIGEWALRWTEGSEALQITFVMFVFPLIMNAIQYYIIDSFIKDAAGGGGHEAVPTDERERLSESHQPLRSDMDLRDGDDDGDGEGYGVSRKGTTNILKGSGTLHTREISKSSGVDAPAGTGASGSITLDDGPRRRSLDEMSHLR